MEVNYKEDVKRILLIYKYNPEYREEYYDKLFARNKNKLLLAMLDLFDEEINNFKYDDNTDLTYLFTLLELLPDVIKKNQYLQQTTINRFTDIHRNINEIIHIKPNNMNKIEQNRYKLIKNLLYKMEDTILKFSYEIPADYDPTKEEFISYIIFKSKNINHFSMAIEEFPYIVNIKDDNEIPLINRVLDEYLKALDDYISTTNLGPIDDLIYYRKVMNILLSSPKLALSEDDKEELINKLNNHLNNREYAVVRQKEKHSFFINTMIMSIMGIEDENTLENLNYAYEVHDV